MRGVAIENSNLNKIQKIIDIKVCSKINRTYVEKLQMNLK